MKIIITKKQYKDLVYTLIDTITGGELSVKDISDYGRYDIFDSYGEEIMNIYTKKGGGLNPGCKNDLGLDPDFVKTLEGYIPYFRKKIFSKVLIDYVYDKTNIKCDCIDYNYGSDDRRFAYNVKKKKKVRFNESVDDRQSLDKIIYDFLEDEYYPDYNWGPELFDFYREDVKEYGSITFYINDSEGYIYYDDGTLEVLPWVCERLNSWFNDSWQPVFKKWFEEYSGLKVNRIVTDDHITTLNESKNIDKNKKLITDIVGFDFSKRLKMVTSVYDLPMDFDECITTKSFNRYLNDFGPMYHFMFKGSRILYQDRGDYELFIYADSCSYYTENEIPEKLGIAILGLKFSDVINLFFEE
jgi:hypothetical protein